MRTKQIHNPNCDGDHCSAETGEVRRVPLGGESAAILCRTCCQHEMAFRIEFNNIEGNPTLPIPSWESLEVYSVEPTISLCNE